MMADESTKTCSGIEVIEEIEIVEKAEEVKEDKGDTNKTTVEKWTMLNASNEQSDNESSQSQETQGSWIMVNHNTVSKNDDVVPKDKNEVSKDDNFSNNHRISRIEENSESFDRSDSISVITESSDTDSNQISTIDPSLKINFVFQGRSRFFTEIQGEELRTLQRNCFVAIGIIIIFFLYLFALPESSQVSNEIDRENFKIATYNIDNIYKELPQVKAMLSEIQARISDDANIRKNFLVQLSEIIDSSNKMNNKPIMTVTESFASNSYPLNQLQVSLHVLSALAFIDDNTPLKNEMNKILNMVNDTKTFYETLISFNNNTQNDSAVLEFLQSGNDMIRVTSKQLLSDLTEKMNKMMSNVHKKYVKVGQKLNKKLCHLKNILPNDELLKQLTENNQLFKNYDKSCFSNRNLKTSNDKKSRTENNVKQQSEEADEAVLNTKNKKNIQKIYDNGDNSRKNKTDETQNINDSATAHSKKMKLNVDNNYNKIKDKLYEILSYLEDARSDPSKLEQLAKNCGEKSKKSITKCEEKDNAPQSVKIQKKDFLENNFDNILISKQQLNNKCPFSELNKWSEFDRDVIMPNIPDRATESKNIKVNSKREANSTKTAFDHEHSAHTLMEEKSRSKQDDFKLKDSTKKPLNNKNSYNKQKDLSSEGKMKNNIPKDTFNHHESKQSTFNKHTIKRNEKSYMFEKDNVRTDARKKKWQSDSSDWYFERADSRKDARKDVTYQQNWYFQRANSRKNARSYAEYQRDSKRQRKRYPQKIVDEDVSKRN